ncbi:MAG: beta-ketoacyl-[acyl-carrier-protein] synthase II, partial [Candidatus Latescibacteria bacterium]|nr:beta-ketoacyl-[acyl-carrier-protein] synthase II [Candidatus Latescibacterota bacterium]
MGNRVVISGLGVLSPIGLTTKAFWTALCAGKSGISGITKFDVSDFDARIAGELKGFVPEDHMGRKEARRLDEYVQFAVVATQMALEDSGL